MATRGPSAARLECPTFSERTNAAKAKDGGGRLGSISHPGASHPPTLGASCPPIQLPSLSVSISPRKSGANGILLVKLVCKLSTPAKGSPQFTPMLPLAFEERS